MGRVYNALMKAERWNDREGLIGRPLRKSGHRPSASVAEPRDYDPLYHTADGVDAASSSFQTATRTAPVSLDRFLDHRVLYDQPPPGDFNDVAARSGALTAAHRVAVRESPTRGAGAAPKQTPVFAEPSRVVDAGGLKIAPHLAALHNEDPLARERYRTLAVRLLNLGLRRRLKTILVTSAEQGEGKSTIAFNLAWTLASPADRRVLLLDAGASSSWLGHLFQVCPRLGWPEVAEGRCELAGAAVRINPNRLYVLTNGAAGAVSDAGWEAVASPSFERLIPALEREFDILIIDSPPVLESSWAHRLASLADGTVLVVRAGHTHHDAVTEALSLVPPERRLGLVLNESEIEDEVRHRRKEKPRGGSPRRSR